MYNATNVPDSFYPTPLSLSEKMLEGIKFVHEQSVLEPSAGKGDLAKAIVRKFRNDTDKGGYAELCDIDCIEKDEYLQQILKYEFSEENRQKLMVESRAVQQDYSGAGENMAEWRKREQVINEKLAHLYSNFKVVYDDFLTFSSFKTYDYIIANPPFDEGHKHLLKMIEMQERTGGKIVCILNGQTIKNPYSNSRKKLISKLTDLKASIEFLDKEFIEAERATDVSIALIKIDVPKPKRISFVFEDLKKKEYAKREREFGQGLVTDDFIKQRVTFYNAEIELGLNLIREVEAVSPYLSTRTDYRSGKSVPTLRLVLSGGDAFVTENSYIESVRRKYWMELLRNEDFSGKLTSNLRDTLNEKLKSLYNYDFSEYNINCIKLEIAQKMVSAVEETILKLFDEMSNTYSYYDEMSKNTHLYDGWKTNKSYKINSKVILPLGAYNDYGLDFNYDWVRKITDIEKVFSYLDDEPKQADSLEDATKEAKRNNQSKQIETQYFFIDVYKKGTTHLKFKKLDLLEKFNLFGCQRKNWLPPSYGKKTYSEMTQEEKAVIDDFQGEKEYNRILINKEYFLQDTAKLLALSE